jgi:hypothetical protein
VALLGTPLSEGDGAAITQQARFEMISRGEAEVLLFDLAEERPRG